jgi:hypothetical protein
MTVTSFTTSIGSTVTLTATVSGSTTQGSGTAGWLFAPHEGTVTFRNLAQQTLCSSSAWSTKIAYGSQFTPFYRGVWTCTVADTADEYPDLTSPPAGYLPSPLQYGRNTISVQFVPVDTTSDLPTSTEMDISVVDPPSPAYQFTRPMLTMSTVGPCSAFSYVQAIDTPPGSPAKDANGPLADLWDMGLNQRPANPNGAPWDNPGNGCQASTTMSGAPGFGGIPGAPDPTSTSGAPGPIHGCPINFLQTDCPGEPTNWNGPAIGCPTYATLSAQNGATYRGCVTMPTQSGDLTAVAVPSATLQMPIHCAFTYAPPSSSYTPWLGWRGPGTDYHLFDDGNNPNSPSGGTSSIWGEGDGAACSVQAEANEGSSSQANWVPIGQPLVQTMRGGSGYSTNFLVVPLPSANTQVRLSYQYWVLQAGGLDNSGVTDCSTPFPTGCDPNSNGVDPTTGQPLGSIGTDYCAWVQSLALDAYPSAAQGQQFCKYNAGNASGYTPPIEFDVEPGSLLQLGAVPMGILYQPPTEWDTNSFQTQASASRQLTVSMGTGSGFSKGTSSSFGYEATASPGVPDLFQVNMTYGQSWDRSVNSTTSTASSTTNETTVTTFHDETLTNNYSANLAAVLSPPPNPVPPGKNLLDDQHAPWLYDQVVLAPTMDVAAYDLNTCADGSIPVATGSSSYYDLQTAAVVHDLPTCDNGQVAPTAGYFPYALHNSEFPVTIQRLLGCAVQGQCTFSTSPLITLTRGQARSLVSEDPFAATALGYVQAPPGAGVGQNVNPAAVLGQPGQLPLSQYENDSQNSTFTLEQGATTTALQTWAASSSYESTIESVSTNSMSVSAQVGIPLPLDLTFGVGSASVSSSNSSLEGSSFTVNFESSASQENESGWLAETHLDDFSQNFATGPFWPNNVTMYLDPRFDTIMFQVAPPGVSTVTSSVTGQNTTFTITDLIGGTALDTGQLDVFVCPHGSKSNCLVDQNCVVEADVPSSSSNAACPAPAPSSSSNADVQSSFQTSSFTRGKRYDVYVSSPGGLSAPYTIAYK